MASQRDKTFWDRKGTNTNFAQGSLSAHAGFGGNLGIAKLGGDAKGEVGIQSQDIQTTDLIFQGRYVHMQSLRQQAEEKIKKGEMTREQAVNWVSNEINNYTQSFDKWFGTISPDNYGSTAPAEMVKQMFKKRK
ncbi:MAG: hypothetical protein ACK4TF_02670 [Thermodesulfovibrionales bacterium]